MPNVIMLNAVMLNAKYRFLGGVTHYAECHYADCRYIEFHNAECGQTEHNYSLC